MPLAATPSAKRPMMPGFIKKMPSWSPVPLSGTPGTARRPVLPGFIKSRHQYTPVDDSHLREINESDRSVLLARGFGGGEDEEEHSTELPRGSMRMQNMRGRDVTAYEPFRSHAL